MTLSLFFVFLISKSALANCGMREHHEGPKWVKELNLSEQQKESLKTIKEKYHPQIKSIKYKIKAKKELMNSSLQSNASEVEIKKIFADLESLKAEKSKLRFEQTLKIRSILDSEQRKRFKSFDRHHKKQMHKRFDNDENRQGKPRPPHMNNDY